MRKPGSWRTRRNYLRVRGEYSTPRATNLATMELPPRARRIPTIDTQNAIPIGTTSACAENTGSILLTKLSIEELPPRARRILTLPWRSSCAPGTTSACAENTPAMCNLWNLARNYLRVRGEYGGDWAGCFARLELPPRARRIHDEHHGGVEKMGTTSACAENTSRAQQP